VSNDDHDQHNEHDDNYYDHYGHHYHHTMNEGARRIFPTAPCASIPRAEARPETRGV